MTEKEQKFVSSIERKINKYKIPITVKECIDSASKNLVFTIYSDRSKELVDTGIETLLCRKSPYYFMDKYCFIEIPNVGIVPFAPYYFQSELMKEINSLKLVVYLKTRQCGISTLMSLYCLWRCLFRTSETIDVVSVKKSKAQDFVTKMKVSLALLPSFLKIPITEENKTRIKFINGSSITSESATETAGRGDALSFVVLDEVAHYRTDSLTRKILSAVTMTLGRTGGTLALISTPNGVAGQGAYYFEQVSQLQTSGNTPTEKLVEVNWYEVPDIENVRPYRGFNNKLKEYIARDYYGNAQVKKEMRAFFKEVETKWQENEWLAAQHKLLGDTLFRQEVYHDFVIMGNSVFSSDKMENVQKRYKDPIFKDLLPNKEGMAVKGLWIWKKPEKGHKYIIGVDISTGTGKDSSCMQVFDIYEYEQVAEFKAFISTTDFPRVIKNTARYYNNAFLIIECNSIGEAVFNGVFYDQLDPYYNLFKVKISKNGIQRYTGWLTDPKTRPLITNEFIDWINVEERWNRLKIYSSRLMTEMSTWVWGSGGKPDHVEGAFDDSIIAFSLCLYHRNLVETSGDSFLIAEDGSVLEKLGKNIDSEEQKVDTIEFSNKESITEKLYGISREDYAWIVGKPL